MALTVKKIIEIPTERYPWTHRVAFTNHRGQYSVFKWTEELDIPGIWVNGAFYTTADYAVIISLKWSDL